MNRQDRAQLQQLIRVLDKLKGSNPDMPLQHAVAFLHIAVQPGMNITDLSEVSQTTLQSASRHVQALGKLGKEKKMLVAAGFGRDGRTKALLLTDGGRSLANEVVASLKPLLNANVRA
ncbi:MarR family winged helix-turn-helix transcriptional regulator [Polaromonas sp. YR568]|uniref:MarR family transcriptional regulator n=1 Tax=Polaromonas sp. YR568 TaxID=1855301 RepID=UPI003137C420